MSKITKKQFLADVMHEINMLKANATPDEIARLNFEVFNPENIHNCIYGQMAGSCQNRRARELMDASCIRQMSVNSGACDLINKPFAKVVDLINGEYDAKTWGKYGRRWSYLSALEGYINLKDAKNKEIIAYLKGETETLTL